MSNEERERARGGAGDGAAAGVSGSRLRLEPWGVDYLGSLQDLAGFGGAPADGEGEGAELDAQALEFEMRLDEWRPLAPRDPARIPRVLFLDGVRRIEARVLLEDDPRASGGPRGSLAFGALGSCAVAAVVSELADGDATRAAHGPFGAQGRAAYLGEPVIERWCALAGGRTGTPDVTLTARGGGQRSVYRVAASPESDADAPVRLLQAKMREAERNVAARLLPELGDGVLLCDGPRPLLGDDRRVLGYLKTVQSQRLPGAALAVVRALAEGERSPLYVVGEGERARFEWYVRLRNPGAWLHTLAGSVRLQAYAGPDPRAQLAWARAVADWSGAVLPRFATRGHQDPRAPQQLLPVRALEQMLRRRLGSAPLLRRRLVAALSADARAADSRTPGAHSVDARTAGARPAGGPDSRTPATTPTTEGSHPE